MLCEDSRKGGRPYKGKAGSALIADRDLENIMTFVFSGFSFILHLCDQGLCIQLAFRKTVNATGIQ